MPRGVKVERPVSTEPVEQPIQASTIVVLHPGSTTLWLGRATDHYPQSIPHVIARQKPPHCDIDVPEESLLHRDGLNESDSETQRQLALSLVEQAIWSRKSTLGSKKHHVSSSQVASFNSKVSPEVLEEESSIKWTDVSHRPPVLIGEQALYVHPDEPYTLHWPMMFGHLNLHDGPSGSLTAVCANLETLWAYAIQSSLDIPLRDLAFYRVVLVIPDVFDKNHIREMMDILVSKLGFSSAIIHQESVCSTFGCGQSSACVVDVGDHKTSICCVEDGLVIPSTRLWLQYGGRDITRCFFWLLQRVNFPYKECDLNSKLDVLLLQELKETFCHLSTEIASGQVHEFQVIRPHQRPRMYKLKLGDEAIQAPMAMFFPQLFGIVGERLVFSPEHQYEASEDLLGDRHILESTRGERGEKGEKGDQSGRGTGAKHSLGGDSLIDVENDVSSAVIANNRQRLTAPSAEKSLGLDQAILYSIDCCPSEESKRKMYSAVLLTGGGFMFNGAATVLQSRLQAKLPLTFRKLLDQVEVIARPKDMDPRTIRWKGGAILSILDTAQELWITQREWMTYGMRVLRERSPFIWTSAAS